MTPHTSPTASLSNNHPNLCPMQLFCLFIQYLVIWACYLSDKCNVLYVCGVYADIYGIMVIVMPSLNEVQKCLIVTTALLRS